MPRQKRHRNRVYQLVGEPGPGSLVVGYVRYSSDMQDASTLVTQKRVITEFAKKKGWEIARWYEEPAHSAKYEEAEKRPVFARLLSDAEAKKFQAVLCYSNNRWARNVALATTSLSRLRRAKVWWATADGLFDIDRIQEDAGGMIHVLDAQISEAYIRQLSKRTIDGKEDRAREGYHNGWVPFGYLPPEYPAPPAGAPSTWKPPRMPVRPDPQTWGALVRIGELAAQGWADRAIADELEGYVSRTSRFGERMLTKDTVAAIRRSWFPRELTPGSGRGTIETPSGELVEGKHQAAWSYELWRRMIETKEGQYRRPTKDAQRKPHEFSRIIVCAACRRPLRVTDPKGMGYYQDTSIVRKLDCPIPEMLSVRGSTVIYQFSDLLRSVVLPAAWREVIVERYAQRVEQVDSSVEKVQKRRTDLESEQKRLVTLFAKGYITENDLDAQMESIRAELLALAVPVEQSREESVQAAISAGETLENMAGYWSEATSEERRDIVWSLLNLEGLIYDLERQVIIGLLPRVSLLPVLALGLEGTGQWEQRDGGLWMHTDYWPPKRNREKRHPPPPLPSLTPQSQEEAIRLLTEEQKSLRQVASILGVSYETIRRVAKERGIVLRRSQKLTREEREEAFKLLDMGVSLRSVARQFGVNAESLRRLMKRRQGE